MLIENTYHGSFLWWKTVILDIDGVLIDSTQRVAKHMNELVDGVSVVKGSLTPEEWIAYEADAHTDRPTLLLPVVNSLKAVFNIVLVTARPVREYENTWKCLESYNLSRSNYQIYMRPDTSVPSADYKREVVRDLHKRGQKIAFAVDDERKVIDAYVQEGITALRMYNLLDPNSTRYHY